MKIVMYGSGAAGSVFASFLRGGGADMVLVDRYKAHMEKVAADGMYFTVHQQVNGEYQDETRHLTGFRTYTDAESAVKAEGKADIIIYMTKATQLEQAVQDSLPLVGEETVAVELINGLGNDDILFRTFPKNRCIVGSGVLGTVLPEPGVCIVTPAGDVHMNFGGAERSERSDRACEELEACFRGGGCNAFWRKDDIYRYIWLKVILNTTVNVVCAVLRLKAGYVEDDPAGRWLYHSIVRECCAVATAKGVPFDAEEFIEKEHIPCIANIYDYYPSMAQDVLMNRRQTEIDNLNGMIVKYGEELGIPTPVCKVLTEEIHCIQANYDKQYREAT